MNPGMMGSAMGGGMRAGMMQPGAGGMAPGTNPADMAKMMASKMGGMGNRAGMQGAPGGAAGGAPGPGGSNAANGPANLHTPEGAVTAFLNALKAKDLDSLNEAMAGHAPVEAAALKTRELFQKIFDLNLPDSDLDDLAKKLEGYQIVTVNPPKSTGRLDVVIQKRAENGSVLGRRVTVRHEKKGWGVVDITGPSEFKAMNNFSGRRKNY